MTIGYDVKDNTLRLWVRDTGIGIPAEHCDEHLFERFYTGRDGNTGIGLALAKDIILLHGWKITAERRNGGICFTVNCT